MKFGMGMFIDFKGQSLPDKRGKVILLSEELPARLMANMSSSSSTCVPLYWDNFTQMVLDRTDKKPGPVGPDKMTLAESWSFQSEPRPMVRRLGSSRRNWFMRIKIPLKLDALLMIHNRLPVKATEGVCPGVVKVYWSFGAKLTPSERFSQPKKGVHELHTYSFNDLLLISLQA